MNSSYAWIHTKVRMSTFQLVKPDPKRPWTCWSNRSIHNHGQLGWTAVRSDRVDNFEKKETSITVKFKYHGSYLYVLTLTLLKSGSRIQTNKARWLFLSHLWPLLKQACQPNLWCTLYNREHLWRKLLIWTRKGNIFVTNSLSCNRYNRVWLILYWTFVRN